MSHNQTALLKMITHISDNKFRQIFTGRFQIPSDVDLLLKHCETAKEVGAYAVAAWVMFTIGGAYMYTGQLDTAQQYYLEARQLAAEVNDLKHMAGAHVNLGEVERLRGAFELALSHFRQGLGLMEQAILLPETMPTSLTNDAVNSMLLANTGLTLNALQRYDDAEAVFKRALEYFGGADRASVDVMVEVRRGLAEVYAHRGNYTAGWQSLTLAEQSAATHDQRVSLCEIAMMRAHLAHADEAHPTPPETYYAEAHRLLAELDNPVMAARLLLAQALYHQRNEKPDMAKQLAAQAHDHFGRLNMATERDVAAVLMV